jgi:hypothetical protein
VLLLGEEIQKEKRRIKKKERERERGKMLVCKERREYAFRY